MPSNVNLSRRLVLEEQQRTSDAAGGYSNHWQPLGVLWADVSAKSGRDGNHAGGTQALVRYRIIVRSAAPGSSARVRAGQRFREGARMFFVNAVTDYDRDGLYLECWAQEEAMQ